MAAIIIIIGIGKKAQNNDNSNTTGILLKRE